MQQIMFRRWQSADEMSTCTCSPFVRGFVPGVLIGIFTSVLLVSLWRSSPLTSVSTDRIALVKEQFTRVDGDSARQGDCGAHYLYPAPVPGAHLLLVLVHSHPTKAALRQAIRSTWLSDHAHQTQYVAKFVVGTKGLDQGALLELACENKDHGDMLLLPQVRDEFLEWPSSYKLLSSFVWAVNNTRFSYIFKANDVSFAVLSNIIKLLQNQRTDKSLLWGFFSGGVRATKDGRLGEKHWFLCNNYLPHPQGGGYVISLDLVEMLVSMVDDLEQYDHDDIAIGVWLSPFDGIQKRHDNRFNTGYYSRGCNNLYMVTHRETVRSMEDKYLSYKSSGKICSEEIQSRLSYIYNWTAPADRCCVRKVGIP